MIDLDGKKKSGTRTEDKGESRKTHVDHGRRAFTKAGLGAVPLIITLSSRPVWAGCISNMLSYNPSGHRHEEARCDPTGFSPQYWRDNPEAWPSGVSYGECDKPSGCQSCDDYRGGTRVGEILPGGADVPIRRLLCSRSDSYLAYCCAAYLNAIALPDQYSLTLDHVMGIWEGTLLSELSKGEVQALLAQTWG